MHGALSSFLSPICVPTGEDSPVLLTGEKALPIVETDMVTLFGVEGAGLAFANEM